MCEGVVRISLAGIESLPLFEVAIDVHQVYIHIRVAHQIPPQFLEVTDDKSNPRKTPVMEVQQRWPPIDEGGVGPVAVMKLENFRQDRAANYRKGLH